MNHPNKLICAAVLELMTKISEHHDSAPDDVPVMALFIKPDGEVKAVTQMNPEQARLFFKHLAESDIKTEQYKGGNLN